MCIYYFTVTPTNLRAMLIAPILMAVAQFSGVSILVCYAATIFGNTGSSIDPNTSTVVLGITQLIGTISATILIDRLGRRILLIVSTTFSAISLCVIATYTLFNEFDYDLEEWNWIPVVSFSMFIFVSAIGINPVPYVIVSEVLPQKVFNRVFTFNLQIHIYSNSFLDSPDRSHHWRVYSQCICVHNAFGIPLDNGFSRLGGMFFRIQFCKLRWFNLYCFCCTGNKRQKS